MPHTAYHCILIIFCSILPIIILEPSIHHNDRLYQPGRPPTQRPVCTRTARVPTRVVELTWLIRHNENPLRHTQPRLVSPTNIKPHDTKHHEPRILSTPMQTEPKVRFRYNHSSITIGWQSKRNNDDGTIARSARWQENPRSNAEQLHTKQQRQGSLEDRQQHCRRGRRCCTKVSCDITLSHPRLHPTHRLSAKFGNTAEDESPQTHANPIAD